LFPAADRQAAVLRVDMRADHHRALIAEQQRRTDFKFLDLGDFARMRGQGGGQCHFGKARTRKDGRFANDMVGKQRIELGVELVFPGQIVLRQWIAQQRVQLAPINQPHRLHRQWVPMALPLPGVVG
jgi:hypothetical protein